MTLFISHDVQSDECTFCCSCDRANAINSNSILKIQEHVQIIYVANN